MLVEEGTVTATDTDFLHYYVRITVSPYSDLILSQPYQKHREAFALVLIVDALEDGVGRIRCILHVE
jgi:hypothetical protein